MKELSVPQEVEIAIALNARIKGLQKLIDEAKELELDYAQLENSLLTCKSALSVLGF